MIRSSYFAKFKRSAGNRTWVLTQLSRTVSRDGLWRILSRMGCPPPPPPQFPQNPSTTPYRSAPTLFAIFFSMMFREAKDDLQDGIYIRARTDGSVFNLRHLLSRTKTSEKLTTDLLFADDCGPSGAHRGSPPENHHILRQRSDSLWTNHQPQENRSHASESLS